MEWLWEACLAHSDFRLRPGCLKQVGDVVCTVRFGYLVNQHICSLQHGAYVSAWVLEAERFV